MVNCNHSLRKSQYHHYFPAFRKRMPAKKLGASMNEKHIRILAVVATIAAICMYTSYIFQIQENLAGHKASPVQPLCAAINCTLWVVYGLFKTPRDLPVAIANAPGVVLGIITCITSF